MGPTLGRVRAKLGNGKIAKLIDVMGAILSEEMGGMLGESVGALKGFYVGQ
jgi:hypothetical protein